MTPSAARTPSAWPRRLQRWAPAVLTAAALVAMLWWTWGTWPDVLVDFGRELYAPWQISQGKVLYRDLAWFNGPLSVYVNAGWFRLLGVGLRSLVIGNLAIVLVSLWLLFIITARAAGRFAATLATLTFVAMFGFSIGNYNFVSPYSHELTHGFVLALAAIACFQTVLRSGSRAALAGTGLTLGLVFLTKAEVFLAIAVALAAGFAAAMRVGAIAPGRRARAAGLLIAAALVPPAVAAALFWRVMPVADAVLSAAGAWRYVLHNAPSSLVFYRQMAGLVHPGVSLAAVMLAAAVYVAAFGMAIFGAFAARRRLSSHLRSTGLAFVAGAVLVSILGRVASLGEAARPLPLFMLIFAGVIGARIVRRPPPAPDERAAIVVRLTCVVFAFVMLARVLLNAAFYRYGFVLALPATVVLMAALVDRIPKRLAAAGADGRAFRAFGLAAWMALMASHLGGAFAYISLKTQAVAAGPDAFLADSRATDVNAALVEIARRVRPDQTLVVLPEGVMLNYLSRRVAPTPYVNFMPLELALFGEARIVAALGEHPPDYVALVHKDTSEYGVRFFGRDYGRDLQAWVDARYRPVRTWGAVPLQGGGFGISLLERIDSK